MYIYNNNIFSNNLLVFCCLYIITIPKNIRKVIDLFIYV